MFSPRTRDSCLGKCKSDITYVFVYISCWQSVNKILNQNYSNSFYLCDFQCKLSTILSSNRIKSIGLNLWCVLYLLPYHFASFDTFAVGSTMYNNNLSTWNRGFVRFRMINEISSFDEYINTSRIICESRQINNQTFLITNNFLFFFSQLP